MIPSHLRPRPQFDYVGAWIVSMGIIALAISLLLT
jgi:hypothetical protein